MSYKIVRYYQQGFKKRTIDNGLSLSEAQTHCNDDESSYDTCTTPVGAARTRKHGPWFDGFTKE